MTGRILSLILGGRAPAWDAPAPPDYPRRTLGWYLDRARSAQAEHEQRGSDQLEPRWRVVREAQRIIDETPRDD